jgi:hypothetical protein
MFGPLRKGAVDDLMIVAQIGQSLDGRIATETGHSKYYDRHELTKFHEARASSQTKADNTPFFSWGNGFSFAPKGSRLQAG